MPLNQAQIQAAVQAQQAAAQDASQQVRLIAGPGTGKSSAIEERVRWLLSNGIQPAAICAVSFTRASALDLRQRVHSYCAGHGLANASQVRVTTLHSLALRTLRAAGLLVAYPADPLVLDSWEVERVFDAEFGQTLGIGKKRCALIRSEHEALWATGAWAPPNYVPPDPPITPIERGQFTMFHGPRTQAYACVLPGEIVRQCVAQSVAGTVDPVALLHLEHLIVDEFQDLNPMDLTFVDEIAARGVGVFVAGDDDQSIYSFRFASPAGIQTFVGKYPGCGQHALGACFRCTPNVLASAQTLITANAQPGRIPKHHFSLYAGTQPPADGVLHRWRFATGHAEARAIAESCGDLIGAGLNPRDILILAGNQRALLPALETELQAAGISFESPREEGFLDSEAGRLVVSVVRIVCDTNDYMAHRVLLGLMPGVGIRTCTAITDAVIANNLNYRDMFYLPALPAGAFSTRGVAALSKARAVCTQSQNWDKADTIAARVGDISAIVAEAMTPNDAVAWQTYSNALPPDMSLAELRDYLSADTDEQQASILKTVLERLGLPVPVGGVLPPRVRLMTMHGAKGLSAKVVFIPGLEEEILPGPWRRPYPGLVLEAARLLYVSITRARAACILSYAQARFVNGKFGPRTPSRFAANLGGPFALRPGGLTPVETTQLTNQIALL